MPRTRGPVVASPAQPQHRNAIGSYSGSYAVYRALAVATRALAPDHRPDLTDTAPVAAIGPWPQWADPKKIVSLDPYGHLVGEVFAGQIRAGIDVRPTIAVTAAHINLPEIRQRILSGDIVPDGSARAGNRRNPRHQGRDRPGLVSARHRRAVRRRRIRIAPRGCSRKPAACSRSW